MTGETENHKKFDSKSNEYELGRPSYPDASIQFLMEKFDLDRSSKVADIGAGTGIFTRSLTKFFNNVVAVEPNDEMRSHISSPSIKGTGESTTLADNSVDSVFVAQAFHWFHIEKSRLELQRIIKKPCPVALIWNDRDLEPEASKVLDEVMAKARGHSRQTLEADMKAISDFFQSPTVQVEEFANPCKLSREALCGMVLSRSYAPIAGSDAYSELAADLDKLFDRYEDGGFFGLSYTTRVYWGFLS